MKENTFIFGKIKQQIGSNHKLTAMITHTTTVLLKNILLQDTTIYIKCQFTPINLSIDINQELMSSPLM